MSFFVHAMKRDIPRYPQFPQYNDVCTRIGTYNNWQNPGVQPQVLALAGFFSTGENKVFAQHSLQVCVCVQRRL